MPRRWLEAWLAERLFPAGTQADDFLLPAGEPALTAADSVSWQVVKNPLSVFIGGVAAVVLELAEPRVRSGVWDHTTFRAAPLARIQRTGYATMMTIYGPRSRTERMIAAINGRHRAIAGTTPGGLAYRADDEPLLEWVQVTANYGFLEAYRTWVRPLAAADVDRFYAEGQAAARLYGVAHPPGCASEVAAVLQKMQALLEPSDIIFEFLRIVQDMPALPRIARPLQGLLIKAAVQSLPARTRTQLGLDGRHWQLASWQAALLRALCRAADRFPLDTHPAVQACRRMGLDGARLYSA